MPFLEGLTGAIGKVGRKIYDTTPRPKTSFDSMSLKEKLQSLVFTFRTQDRELRFRRHLVWYQMILYYRGFQSLDLMEDGSGWDIMSPQDYYTENQTRKHVDTVVNMLNKMEGDVVVRPGSDTPQDIATARVADQVLDFMRSNVGYDKIRHEKNLYKALTGNAFVFTDYIVSPRYGTIVQPTYDYQEMPVPDMPMGPDMGGMAGQDLDMAMPEETLLSKIVTGYKKRPKGQEIAVVCSPLEINCRPDIKGGLENLPYLQWITRQDTELLNYIYPGLNISGGMSSVEQDLAQQYIDVLSVLPGSLWNDSLAYNRGSSVLNKAELVRSWLQPCTFRGDKDLENKFPNGVHVVTVNGKVVDYYEEDLRDRWTHEVLIPVPHQFFGDGLFDAIKMQDQINEVDSLLIQHMRYTTVGHKIYDALIIDPKDVVNEPKNGWIPGKPTMDKTISNAVQEINPGTLSQDVGKWLGALKEAMQDMTSAYDPATGKGLGANTPYSQSVFLNEKAQGRWSGSLAYNRPELIKFHRQLLEIAKSNWIDDRTVKMMDNTGKWSFETFSQADLQGDVDIILSNTDFKPRSRAEKMQGLEAYVQLLPILPTLAPRQKLSIEEVLDLGTDLNPISTQIKRAYRMIERIIKGEVVSPTPMVDIAEAQVPVFQEWLASEKGEEFQETNPQVWANVFTYMTNLIGQGMMQRSSGVPQHGMPQQGGPPPQQQGQPKGQAGGQFGQKGGGSPSAQSPMQPSPPVSPPSPSATT